jgi:protocatechuate 3,4-dioxygenase alpha subunit
MRGMLLHAFTRIYFSDEAANATDKVLNAVPAERRQTLIATHQGGGIYRFDIHMQGDQETVFFDA